MDDVLVALAVFLSAVMNLLVVVVVVDDDEDDAVADAELLPIRFSLLLALPARFGDAFSTLNFDNFSLLLVGDDEVFASITVVFTVWFEFDLVSAKALCLRRNQKSQRF